MEINTIQDEIIDEFSVFDNRNDSYNYIIELGKNLPPYPEPFRTEEKLIKGCQSKVWVHPYMQDNKVVFDGDSDSILVKGLVSLVVRVLSNQKPADIVKADLYFIDKIGLRQMLSMNRSNGFAALVKQVKLYALAYQTQEV
jgi:cysteine desulfuration protein SufE